MAAGGTAVPRARLAGGQSLDRDFPAVPAPREEEPLEKHAVSRRRRSPKGIRACRARDTRQQALCSARAGIAQADQAGAIRRCVAAWQRPTGPVPEELVCDSRRTPAGQRQRLHERGIHFSTWRRRTRPLRSVRGSRPAAAWRRITLPALTRTCRTPKVLEERVRRRGEAEELRPVTVSALGPEEPPILLTANGPIRCPALVTRYAQRRRIAKGIADARNFFHRDALSRRGGWAVDFDLQSTVRARALDRLLARRVGGG